MEDSIDLATSTRSRSRRRSEMRPREVTRSLERSESPESNVAPKHPVREHHKQILGAGLERRNPATDTAEAEMDVEMADTATFPVTRVTTTNSTTEAHHVAATAEMASAKSASSRAQVVTTSKKMRSSMTIPASLHSVPSMPTMQAPPSASRPTSTLKTVTGPVTLFERPDTKLTANCTVPATPDTILSTAHKVGNNNSRPQTPVRHQRSNLHKRRASASPDKFNSTRIDPLQISTDLEDNPVDSPIQRGRTQDKIATYGDTTGVPQLGSPLTAHQTAASAKPETHTMANHNLPVGSANAQQQPPAKRGAIKRRKGFSLLESFVRDSGLLITLTSYLDIPSIISLYAISKSFHLQFNRHATAFILSSMRTWAPDADKIFPWRCYRNLCIKDPIRRQKAVPKAYEAKIDRMGDLSRDVPSLRWLQMVVWREAIVSDMIMLLNARALRTQNRTLDAVKRMWFALDLPLNAHRLALFRDKTYMPNSVIFTATCFFIKVDMAFTDPGIDPYPLNHPNQALFPNQWAFGGALGCNLREKLTAERNLTPLWRVLNGWTWDPEEPQRPMTAADILKLSVRHNFRWQDGTPEGILKTPIMGMWYSDFKFTGCERTYRDSDDEDTKLKRPCRPILSLDKLLMGEDVRRQLRASENYMDMIAFGFFGPHFGRVPVLTVEQQRKAIRKSTGYPQPAPARLAEILTASKEAFKDMIEA